MSDLYAAPTEEELQSSSTTNGDMFAPPTEEELKATAPKSLAGFGQNLVQDVKDTGAGLGKLAQGIVEHPVDTATNVVKGLPSSIVSEGKRVGLGELLTGHPINAVEKLGNAFYDKPLTTGLEVAPVAGEAAEALGIGGKAGEAGKLASQAGNVAEKALPEAADESLLGKIAKNVPTGQPGLPDAQKAIQKAKEVGDYIGKRYESFAKQPGRAADIADYIQEKSQMMANQQLGATPLQARQVGHEGMRAIGQYAIDQDIVTPTNGIKGMMARNKELLNAAGDKLSALRKEADGLRDPTQVPVDVLQEVKNRLDPKYTRGAFSGQGGEYQKALEELEDAKPTFEGTSEAATKLNHRANEAARLNQPHGPFTDVANIASEINNERIKALLGPQKAAEYEQALREYGVNKKISSMLERKAAGEVKRLGPGSVTRELTQKFMDEIGYKVGARAANKTATAVLKNPSVGKSLPSLFKDFIHHVDEVAPGAEGGMAHGGIVDVDDEMHDFLKSKYEQKEKQ